jgi:hypothetical protein
MMEKPSRWETYLALVAVVLASLSAIPIGGRPRPLPAFAAIAILVAIVYMRFRSAFTRRRAKRTFDAYERALRIQEERERKYGR